MTKKRFAKYFDKKNILILGFGTEGRSSYDLISKNFPDARITVYDRERSRTVQLSGDIDHIRDDFDLILKSPGIVLPAGFSLRYKNIITSQTDIFLREFHDQVIGITGTKGKSTTVQLLHNILNNCGKDTILAGNIGVPVFDIIDKVKKQTIIVLELSSHQLQNIKTAPGISAILNVYPEHLDHYRNFIEYRQAKMNIVRMQDKDDHIIFPIKEFSGLERRSVSLPFEIIIDGDDVIVYYRENSIVFSKRCVQIKGDHNFYNIGTALIAADITGCDTETAVQTVYDFRGLEHRLEYFGDFNGIKFFDDSISTIPESTIAAIKALNNNIGSLILGGHYRGPEIIFSSLACEIKRSDIENIFFLPDTGMIIFEELLRSGFEKIILNENICLKSDDIEINVFFCSSFEEIVPLVFKNTRQGSNCILSPASSSYNMFKNFKERGNKFKLAVKEYYQKGKK